MTNRVAKNVRFVNRDKEKSQTRACAQAPKRNSRYGLKGRNVHDRFNERRLPDGLAKRRASDVRSEDHERHWQRLPHRLNATGFGQHHATPDRTAVNEMDTPSPSLIVERARPRKLP